MTTSAHRIARIVAPLIVLAACVLPAAAATRFVVVIDPAAVPATLTNHHLSLVRTAWTSGSATVIVVDLLTPPTTIETLDRVDALLTSSDVYGAGVIVDDQPSHISFYAGQVLVRFGSRTDEATARGWAGSHGFTLQEPAGEPNAYVVRAPIETATLQIHQAQPGAIGLAAFTPIFHKTNAPGNQPHVSGIKYHRYPAGRNVLAVEKRQGPAPPSFAAVVATHGGTFLKPALVSIELREYEDEAAMMEAQRQFVADPHVVRAGPVVRDDPLMFMTNQLIVQYQGAAGRLRSLFTLRLFGLEEQRQLPYGEHTRVLSHNEATYDLYDAADHLIGAGDAFLAVPNLFRESPDSCGDTSDCGASHHEYLWLMDVCDTWDDVLMPPTSVVLGILDQGVAKSLSSVNVCSRLRVGAAIDFDGMETCQPPGWDLCKPACDVTAANWDDPHGHQMALTAAARHDTGDLLGVAPAAALVLAARRMSWANDLMSDLTFADGLWWMAGGDPEWCRDGPNYPCTNTVSSLTGCDDPTVCDEGGLPARLPPDKAADVINMSFKWPKDDTEDCTSSPTKTCAKVCGSSVMNCGIVEMVLARIYEPLPGDDVTHGIHGTLPVTAAGTETTQSPEVPDHWLKDLRSTVAVGAVTTSGEAKANSTEINTRGRFMDVVAPTGGDDATQLCASCSLTTGRSSAASAATSGIAVLMLRQNPRLTPPQMHCILRETADDSPPGMWSSSDPDPGGEPACKFNGEKSDCMGHGLVDACAAVEAARDCLCGCCICDEAGEKNSCSASEVGTTIFEGEMRLFISAPDDLAIPDFVWELIECAEVTKDCRCVLNPEDCFRVDVRNSYGYDIFDITAEVCIENRCWELPGRWSKWRAGELIEFSLRVGEEALRWSRRVDQPLTLRFLSRGVPIGERGSGSERPK